jgi:hypothetical protein
VAPAGPAGPGTGTTATGAVTTVGRSQALKASVESTAAKMIEYFMVIPFLWVLHKCAQNAGSKSGSFGNDRDASPAPR